MKRMTATIVLFLLWIGAVPAALAASLNGIWSNSSGGYLVMLEQSGGNTVVILQVDPALSSGSVYLGTRSGDTVSAQGITKTATLALAVTNTQYTGTLATSGTASQSLNGQLLFAYEGSANDGIWQRTGTSDRYLAFISTSINQASAVVILDVTLGATPSYDVMVGAMAGTNFVGKSLLRGHGVTMTLSGGSPATATYKVMSTALPPQQLENFAVSQIIAAGASQTFRVTSSSFAEGAAIPVKHACTDKGGSNVSPALAWLNPPTGTAGYAVIMDDEIAPCGTGDSACIHWNVFNLPANATGLTEGSNPQALSSSVVLGETYNGSASYQGPCPPNPHTYKTSIYALNKLITFSATPSLTRSQFARSYAAHILDSTTLTGSFGQ